MGFSGGNEQGIGGGPSMMDFRPSIQSDAIRLQNHMMVRRCHVDVPGLDWSTILSKGCRVLSAVAQQMRQHASLNADMHSDKDRRQAWHGQCRNDAPKGVKATG